MDPNIRKMANKQGTTLGNIFNRKNNDESAKINFTKFV